MGELEDPCAEIVRIVAASVSGPWARIEMTVESGDIWATFEAHAVDADGTRRLFFVRAADRMHALVDRMQERSVADGKGRWRWARFTVLPDGRCGTEFMS